MINIRYVCLSDMHLGEEDSLLTNVTGPDKVDLKSPSPVMIHLEKCLRHLISQTNDAWKKPTLVLNGDILELALCTTEKSAMVFERLIELTMPVGGELFEKIIYMPGNHDHHFWETGREVQYLGGDKRERWPKSNYKLTRTSICVAYLLTNIPSNIIRERVYHESEARPYCLKLLYCPPSGRIRHA